MLRKSFSFVVVGTMLLMLVVFIAAGALQVQAQSRGAGQLQYWVTIERDLASVRAQQGDFKEGPAAFFERQSATGRWQRLEQDGRESSAASAPRTFGYAMAIDGDYAIVGAEWHDGFKGGAYIYKRKGDGWTEVQKLSPPDLGRFDHFGSTVSISGDYAVVAATWHDLLRGAAYVFKREGKEWVQQDKLTAADARTDDRFGRTVRIDGSEITISNTSASLQDAGTHLAYRFRRSGDAWVEGQKVALPALEKSGAYAGELFIESETGSDVLALAETIGRDTETPPLLAPTSTKHYFIRGDVFADGILDEGDQGILSGILEGAPASCEDAADVNDDGMINEDDWDYLEAWLYLEGPAPPSPFPRCGPDTSEDGLGCAEYTAPCFIVTATYDAFEDRVEIVWSSVGLDAIVYKIKRNGTLISLASSEDSLYADKAGDPAVSYEYCVVVVDMAGEELDSDCDDGRRIIFPPTDVWASDGQFDQFVRVTWTDMSSVEAGYLIKRNGGEIHTASPNAVVFDDTTAAPEITYNYEVIAFDANMNYSTAVGDSGFRGSILPPLDVSASSGEYADTVRITWIDQTENEAGYNIYRNDAPIASTDPDVQSYDDMTANYGVSYNYCVKTRDELSGESIPVCDSGGIGILPAPGYVIASDSTYDDCIEITWDDPSDLEDGFVILRDGVLLDTTQANASFFKDFTAVPDSTHEYCVFAFTKGGGSSQQVCDDGYRAIVLAPFDVQASDGTREDRVDVTWKSSSTTAVLFKIFRDTTFIKSAGKGTRSYSDYGGIAGQDYEYKVLAVSALGVESDAVSDTGRRELEAPTPVTASDEEYEEKIVISWVDNSWLENGYRVSREDTVTHEVDSVWTLGRNRTSLTDYSAFSGVTYKYTVMAFDTLGAVDDEPQGFSAPATDLGGRVLLPPTNVLASDGKFEKRVEITWEDNSQAEDGYRIYRDDSPVGSTSDNFTFFADTLMIMPGQTSVYSVVAFDTYGESDSASDEGSTVILAPGSFNASDVYEDRVVLTWVDLSEVEEGYEIIRRSDGTVETFSLGADVTSYTDNTALQKMTYRYCIRAVRGGQSSAEVCDEGQLFEPAGATTATELDVMLVASDPAKLDQFGFSVAIDGDVAWPSWGHATTMTRARTRVRPISSPAKATARGPRRTSSRRTTASKATSSAIPWRSRGMWLSSGPPAGKFLFWSKAWWTWAPFTSSPAAPMAPGSRSRSHPTSVMGISFGLPGTLVDSALLSPSAEMWLSSGPRPPSGGGGKCSIIQYGAPAVWP
jgi:fibronectin type 3 domain-containing protein